MPTSPLLKLLRVILAALFGLALLGVYLVLYAGLGIGGEITVQTGAYLALGGLLCLGAFVASFQSAKYCIVLYALALLPLKFLIRDDAVLQRRLQLRSAQARLDMRAAILRSPIQLTCKNGDLAVLTGSDTGHNIMLVPKSAQAPIESLARENADKNAPPPRAVGIDRYVEAHGDCTNARYPSLRALFDRLDSLYQQAHRLD